jgi:aryl-alcohol dehydrogenase-like predicted oxidoreductase
MMRYRRLGRTGLMVSEISLGTVELGMDYGIPVGTEHLRPSETDAARLLHRALDLGVNFIDTARAYGASEEVIGRALKTRRREYFLCSKVALPPADVRGQALVRHVRASIAESLRALQTDYLDVLKIHSTTVEEIRRGEMIAAMLDAVQAGHVRFVGASTYGEEAPLLALADGRYDCLQIAYSAVDRRPEARILPLARQKDVGIVVRSVLLRGALSHRYALLPAPLEELKTAIAKLDALRGSEVASLPELSYRYVLAHEAVSTALVGTARLSELEEVVGFAMRPPLSADLVAAIRQVVVEDDAQLNPGKWPADMGVWRPATGATGT